MTFLRNAFQNRYFRLVFIVALFCLIVISRRTDVVTNPQFYAEDGVFWYSEAYSGDNFWEPFLVPKQGYFQTVSRLGGFMGNLVDTRHAPLIFNTLAILLQILPAVYFLSSRFSKIVPKFYVRFLCSLAYLLLLGTAETHANLTNVQWRLAILMFLIIIVPESKKLGWKIFDGLFLLLASLSGPFVFFALPIAMIYFYYKSFRKSFVKLAILVSAFLIQLYSYFFIVNEAVRSSAPLGSSISNFLKIVSRSIFLRGVIGPHYTGIIMSLKSWENGYIPILIGIIGLVLMGYVLWKAKIELKLFIVFAFLVFAGALISPQVSLDKPQWEVMAGGGGGGRYWLLPGIAWMISLGWLFFGAKYKLLKASAGILLACFVIIGLPNDWIFTAYKDYNFGKQVSEFEKTKPGDEYKFKIVPKWDMVLRKK
jgi:hypothetical protein